MEDIGHGYDGEVVYGFVSLGEFNPPCLERAREALNFHDASRRGLNRIKGQLDELHASGQEIAIWGGTGKGAAFINRYAVDAERFPIVVDSDVSFGMGRMIEQQSEAEGLDPSFRTFREMASACEWLGIE